MNRRLARQRSRIKSKILAMPIREFIEDTGVLKALVAAGITDVGDLMLKTDDEVKAMPGMGRSTFAELQRVLQEHMLHLRIARSHG